MVPTNYITYHVSFIFHFNINSIICGVRVLIVEYYRIYFYIPTISLSEVIYGKDQYFTTYIVKSSTSFFLFLTFKYIFFAQLRSQDISRPIQADQSLTNSLRVLVIDSIYLRVISILNAYSLSNWHFIPQSRASFGTPIFL